MHDSRNSEYHDTYESVSSPQNSELFNDAVNPEPCDTHQFSVPQASLSCIQARTIQRRRTQDAYSRVSAQVRSGQRLSVAINDDRTDLTSRSRTQSQMDLLHYGAYPRHARMNNNHALGRRVRSLPGVHYSDPPGQRSNQRSPRYVRPMAEVSANQASDHELRGSSTMVSEVQFEGGMDHRDSRSFSMCW